MEMGGVQSPAVTGTTEENNTHINDDTNEERKAGPSFVSKFPLLSMMEGGSVLFYPGQVERLYVVTAGCFAVGSAFLIAVPFINTLR